jgi:heptosyltransferase-2
MNRLGLEVKNRRPALFPSETDKEVINQYKTETYYCFAPASVWFTKQLPEKKWIELLQKYSENGKLYLLGGKEDFELCQRIIDTSEVDAVNLTGQLTLLQSAALMQHATRCFVNDSGPMHLASSVNAPVTVFYCSTTPNFGFGPLSDDSEVKEILIKLDCKPCGLHGHIACPIGNFRCGNEIVI